MAEPADDLDEVALNVLLAEWVDPPTAWEASRRDADAGPTTLTGPGTAVAIHFALAVDVSAALALICRGSSLRHAIEAANFACIGPPSGLP